MVPHEVWLRFTRISSHPYDFANTHPQNHTPIQTPGVCHWCVLQPIHITSPTQKNNVTKKNVPESTIHWVVPLPSNSHHQDCYVFSRGSRTKPSFATVTGRGDNPNYTQTVAHQAHQAHWSKKKIQAAELHVIRSTTGLMHPPTTNTLLVTACFFEGRPPPKKKTCYSRCLETTCMNTFIYSYSYLGTYIYVSYLYTYIYIHSKSALVE